MLLEKFLEKRATVLIANPRDPVLANWWGLAGLTEAGISVTYDSALRLTAVFACVRILSESIATLPLSVYRRLADGGKERATNHPLHKLFEYGPNEDQTGFDWLEMQIGHMALRGNAYNRLVYPPAGVLGGVIPLNPDRMRPFRDKNTRKIYYKYTTEDTQQEVVYDASEILHFSVFSDGLMGRSVIDYNREAVGLGIAAEQFGARFFQNGATMSGVLQTDANLSDVARENLKKSMAERHQGAQNAHRFMVLESGLKWQQIGVSPDDAQFLETRKFQISEIARMFRVPPHMLADLEKATFSNIEQQSQEFMTYSLLPWITRIEHRLNKDLLTDTGKRSFFFGFEMKAMLRADSQARSAVYTAGFQTGAYSPNDIRTSEGDNPVAGGDQHYVPLNMVPVGKEQDPAANPAPAQKDQITKAGRAYEPLFRQAWARIVTAEVRGLRRALDGATLQQFGAAANKQLTDIKPLMRKHLTPVLESLRTSIDTGGKLKTADFVEEVIRQHVSELAQELSEAATPEAIRALLDEMDINGVSDIIERETTRAVLWAAGSSA